MNRQLLFIGDIVGELGLAYIEAHLPRYIVGRDDLFVVANGENLAITGTGGPNACGMTMPFLERLLAANFVESVGQELFFTADVRFPK